LQRLEPLTGCPRQHLHLHPGRGCAGDPLPGAAAREATMNAVARPAIVWLVAALMVASVTVASARGRGGGGGRGGARRARRGGARRRRCLARRARGWWLVRAAWRRGRLQRSRTGRERLVRWSTAIGQLPGRWRCRAIRPQRGGAAAVPAALGARDPRAAPGLAGPARPRTGTAPGSAPAEPPAAPEPTRPGPRRLAEECQQPARGLAGLRRRPRLLRRILRARILRWLRLRRHGGSRSRGGCGGRRCSRRRSRSTILLAALHGGSDGRRR